MPIDYDKFNEYIMDYDREATLKDWLKFNKFDVNRCMVAKVEERKVTEDVFETVFTCWENATSASDLRKPKYGNSIKFTDVKDVPAILMDKVSALMPPRKRDRITFMEEIGTIEPLEQGSKEAAVEFITACMKIPFIRTARGGRRKRRERVRFPMTFFSREQLISILPKFIMEVSNNEFTSYKSYIRNYGFIERRVSDVFDRKVRIANPKHADYWRKKIQIEMNKEILNSPFRIVYG